MTANGFAWGAGNPGVVRYDIQNDEWKYFGRSAGCSGGGNDKIFGGSGNDVINSGAGIDKLRGQAGNDSLTAGNGNDQLDGGTGNDQLAGEAGDDRLRGDLGTDLLEGGPGSDRLFELVDGDAMLVTTFSSYDRMSLDLPLFDALRRFDGRPSAEVLEDTLRKPLEIVDYAYGTLGSGIDAGQIQAPGVLGLAGLAMGAAGIRRKRAV